jgi:RNA recognition motif.
MSLDSRPPPVQSPDNVKNEFGSVNSSDTSISSNEQDLAALVPSMIPTSALLVTNLPTLLFSQTLDLHPLLYPFGSIKKLELVKPSAQVGNTAAFVEYALIEDAKEAKEALQGQCYANYTVNAEFVQPLSSPMDPIPTSTANSADRISNLDLNPFVPPLVRNTPRSHVLLGDTQTHSNDFSGQFFFEPQYPSQFALHPSYLLGYHPLPRIVSKSSLAASR